MEQFIRSCDRSGNRASLVLGPVLNLIWMGRRRRIYIEVEPVNLERLGAEVKSDGIARWVHRFLTRLREAIVFWVQENDIVVEGGGEGSGQARPG